MPEYSRPRQDAEAKFAATQMRTQEANRAAHDHETEAHRIDEKTARLKALRNAKEAAAEDTAKSK